MSPFRKHINVISNIEDISTADTIVSIPTKESPAAHEWCRVELGTYGLPKGCFSSYIITFPEASILWVLLLFLLRDFFPNNLLFGTGDSFPSLLGWRLDPVFYIIVFFRRFSRLIGFVKIGFVIVS